MKKDLKKIKERNKRVETDKAWEISISRRSIIALMTYIIISYFLIFIKVPNPFLNAIVPTIGFIISNLTLPFFKKLWINNVYRKYL